MEMVEMEAMVEIVERGAWCTQFEAQCPVLSVHAVGGEGGRDRDAHCHHIFHLPLPVAMQLGPVDPAF